MKKCFLLALVVLVVAASFAAVGFYRSYIDNTDFIIGFDKVATTVISELWAVAKNPTILALLAVCWVLWHTRDYWPQVLLKITEIKAGGISAKLGPIDLAGLPDRGNSSDAAEVELPIDVVETLVKNLHTETRWYLVKVANTRLSLDRHREILTHEVPVFRDLAGKHSWEVEAAAASSYLRALGNIDRLFFDLHFSDDDTLTISISEEVVQLIQKSLLAPTNRSLPNSE